MRYTLIIITAALMITLIQGYMKGKIEDRRVECSKLLDEVHTDTEGVEYDRKCGRVGMYYN